MTFDFAPIWNTDEFATTPVSAQCPLGVALAATHPPVAPSHPSMDQMAALVTELFAEGSLSWDQLKALAGLPEMKGLLSDTVARVSPSRRTGSAEPLPVAG